MHRDEANMVGSNKAGSEVYNPIVHSTVDKLIGRVASTGVQTVAYSSLLPSGVQPLNVYFAGIENRSMEELGDFKEHLKASINERLARTDQIAIVSDRAVDAILRVLDLRADDLLIQDNMRNFASAMGENRSPVDYILFAQITSGTTESNRDMQREYKLTLKLIDTKKWTEFVESSQIRKEYNNSPKGKFFNWFKK
ncbi:MAG: penicillin-binding protein activator LpoB [Planctomycetaceae bacterium]|jgi:hypothetical protein|nr:penicillin-binding protein activator LpoB [Planctomycetaceae bacterium]